MEVEEQDTNTDEMEEEKEDTKIEEENEDTKIAKLMMLRHEELKRACSDRRLFASGTKTELTRRLIAPPEVLRSTESQLSYIASLEKNIAALEKRKEVVMNPDAQLYRRSVSRWIDQLR